MITELNNILNISLEELPNDSSFLVTESKSDSSFILHHFISFYLRSGLNVCLVGLSQAYNHYRNVCMKLGVDLNKEKDAGKLVFVEGLKIIGGHLAETTAITDAGENTKLPETLLVDSIGTPSVKNIVTHINNSIASLQDKQNTSTMVILDDISVLLSIGNTPREILSLVHYVRNQICSRVEIPGCLVTGMHIDNQLEDDDGDFLLRSLTHQSDCTISTSGLPSGYSKDVHGEMHIRWKDVGQTNPAPDRLSSMQYKIMDKNVNFFALGTSAAVL